MRISAIIPVYNAEGHLERAVRSLLETGYADLEIVIVDDGSMDKTLAVARGLGAQYPRQVAVFQHPKGANRGVSATRNLGIEQSTGHLIALLDADDVVLPHRFEFALDILNKDKTVDAVYEKTRFVFESERERASWDDAEFFGIDEPLDGETLYRTLLRGTPWATCSVLIRRKLLDKTGLFDERFSIAEDCHLWFRCAAAGHVVPGCFDRPVSEYHRHDASSYRPRLGRKLQFLEVLADFCSWLKRRGIYDGRLGSAENALRKWIDRSLIVSREGRSKSVGLRVAMSGLKQRPSLAFSKRFLGHIAYLCIGR